MLKSVLRLGTHSGSAVNVLGLASPISLLRQFSRRPVRVLNEVQEESPLKLTPDEDRRPKKKAKHDVFRQSNFDGQYYVKSEVNPKPKESELDGKYSHPQWIEEKNDFRFSKYMIVVKSRKRRREKMITLLEGKRLISDAILAGVMIKAIFVSLRSEFRKLPLPPYNYKLHWMPYRYFQKWSDVKTSSGLMAIVEIPSTKDIAPDPNCLPLTVICDNIRDPGNMGAILRVLAAVGSSKILVTKGSVDIWEPKVLRAGAGAHFRVPIEYDLTWDDINSQLEDESSSVFVADSWNIDNNNVTEVSDSLSPDSDAEEDRDSNLISSDSNAEKDLDRNLISSDSNPNLSNENVCSQKEVSEQTETLDREKLEAVPYYAMKFYPKGKNILIISNEHFGPSKEAIAFTSARQGVKVHIPLYGKVDSLNVVSALSIITFEMRRQSTSC